MTDQPEPVWTAVDADVSIDPQNGRQWTVRDQAGRTVCTIPDVGDPEEQEANARMISASLDMFRACRSALGWLAYIGQTDVVQYERLWDALSKAAPPKEFEETDP